MSEPGDGDVAGEDMADDGAWKAFAGSDDVPTPPVAQPVPPTLPVAQPAPEPTGADIFEGAPLPAALQLPPEPSPGVPAARWRSEAGDYGDEEWESITAEFRALRAQEEADQVGIESVPPPAVPFDDDEEGADEAATPAPARPGGRNVGVAVLTGVGLGVVTLGLIRAGRPWFFALELVLLMLALVELYTAMRHARFQPAAAPGLLGGLILLLGTYRQGVEALGFALSMVLVFTLLWFLLGVIRSHPVANLGVTVLGVLYIAFLGSFAVQILAFPDWQGITFGFLALAIASDLGAYVAGSRFGRRPILRRVSPNKSLEGLLGGGVLVLVVAALLALFKLHPFTMRTALIMAVVVMVAAPLGDLFESVLKRALGVKDLGSILPGHGGILDRLDSILLVAPAVFYYARYVIYR